MEKYYLETLYGKKNLHVIIKNESALIYHTPSSSAFKVSPVTAQAVLDFQDHKTEDLSVVLALHRVLENRPVTHPGHTNWQDTGKLVKLTLIVSNNCNLRCKYCYADYGVYDGYGNTNMTPEVVRDVIDFFIDNGVNEIQYVMFFGGEPLLALDTVEAACEYFSSLYDKGILHSIPEYSTVSNLTLLNEKAIHVIEKYNIAVTASIDGSKEIHDSQRIYQDGSGSYDIVAKNFKKLEKHGASIEATYTMNHIHTGIQIADVRRQLAETFHIDVKDVSAVPAVGDIPLAVDVEKYNTFVEDDMLSNEDSYILAAFDTKYQSDLMCSAGHTVAAVMPNGDIYPCHLFAVDRSSLLGNIYTSNKAQYLKALSPLTYSKAENENCADCWARNICHLCTAKLYMSDIMKNNTPRLNCQKRLDKTEQLLITAIY